MKRKNQPADSSNFLQPELSAFAQTELSADAQKKIESYLEEEEGVMHRHTGWLAWLTGGLLVVMSLFHLYAAYSIVPTLLLRPLHVGFMFVLAFLLFPLVPKLRSRVTPLDWALVAASIAVIGYVILGGDDFNDRNVDPVRLDLIMGTVFLCLILEAARRATGWIMPIITLLFIGYAFAGPLLPEPWTHRGYDLDRLVGHMYMTLEGVFGLAVDVSATLIILFTIYGAFLQASGAGKFFLDFSFAAMGGKRAGVGRTVVLASFLLGGPSGSGVATTVTMGSVAWPLMRKAGYHPNAAGGLLAAGGLGAILSPPVLGAAAFLIAEFLKISYLDVIWMALIPTALYYTSLFVMVELDSKNMGTAAIDIARKDTVSSLVRKKGFHFMSLIAIVAFMLFGFSPTLAVFWTIVTTYLVSFLDRDNALVPRKLIEALKNGSMQSINVAATCAIAGIIVGVVTLTGLGLKFSSIVIALAGGNLLLTAIYSALIVWIVGLAVPVTASYIICAVIAAPALITLGVPDYAAHMFIFYYAVLSEVSPPTALSPFAAAAITRGDPLKTTLQSWKYTLPAFVVPFTFVLDPVDGGAILMKGSFGAIALAFVTALLGVCALACGAQGRLMQVANIWERLLLIGGGLLMVYPSGIADVCGLMLILAAVLLHMIRCRAAQRRAAV